MRQQDRAKSRVRGISRHVYVILTCTAIAPAARVAEEDDEEAQLRALQAELAM
jgi:hypothetical protein